MPGRILPALSHTASIYFAFHLWLVFERWGLQTGGNPPSWKMLELGDYVSVDILREPSPQQTTHMHCTHSLCSALEALAGMPCVNWRFALHYVLRYITLLTYLPLKDWKYPPGSQGQHGCRQSNQISSLQILVCSLPSNVLKMAVCGGNLWRQPRSRLGRACDCR